MHEVPEIGKTTYKVKFGSNKLSWGMTQFRHYLVGRPFTSWGDHEPLLAYFNDLTKPGSVRLKKHRQLIQDLSFTDKFIKGKENPADYSSRHPHSIEHLTTDQREQAGVVDGLDTHNMRRRAMARGGSGPLGTHQRWQISTGAGGQAHQVPGGHGGQEHLRGG